MSLLIVGNVQADVLVNGVAELPPPSTDNLVNDVSLRAAGAALNAGFVLKALGEDPLVIGTVGDDALGRAVLSEVEGRGVRHGVRVVAGSRTGISVAVEAPDRERTFLTHLGAMAELGPDDVPACEPAGDVLIAGYFCLPRLRGDLGRPLLTRVHAAGGRVYLDTGWDFEGWRGSAAAEVLALLGEVDVVLPNQVEAAALTGLADPLAAARVLAAHTREAAVVKLGAGGALAVLADGRELRAVAPTVVALDTTGAGDAFNAGLMAARRGGLAWGPALERACAVASAVVARPSERRWDALDVAVLDRASGGLRAGV